MNNLTSGGGWPAIRYTLNVARKVGWFRLWRTLRSKNACKTCALGMGGQLGGMHNELGRWPEVCKKSLQAIAADAQDGIDPEFFRTHGFDELRKLSPRELEACGRLVQPLYAGPHDDGYSVVSWDQALAHVVNGMKSCEPEQAFFYVSGRSSNEAAFLLQLFARMYGTNHVNNCSYYCHQASGVGLTESLGSGTATVVLDDVEHADLLFLIGGNPASNHPRLMRTLVNIRRRGGHVVVINPVVETGLVNFRVPSDVRSLLFGSEIASDYVQPHIGGDIAVFTGMAKALLSRGAIDQEFIRKATLGWDAYRAQVDGTSWDQIERCGGVDRATIKRLANRYIAARNVVFAWTMGITHHTHGAANVQSIVNLALMRGMVGRRHAGLLPIRGHSNVQGIGSVGVTPKLKEAIFARLKSEYRVNVSTHAGYDTMGCMEAADRGDMGLAFCLGGNLYGANPDASFAERALSKIDTTVYLSTTLNTGHAYGRGRETIILPVLARDEEPQKTTQESMFSYVRLSDGGQAGCEGPRSEVSIIASVARSLLGDDVAVDWAEMEKHQTIRRMIAKVVPGYEKLDDIDRTKEEFQIDGRTFHTPSFPTPSGKATFSPHPIPELRGGSDELRLMTVRSEGQFNTVVYEEEDIYRGQERRDIIMLNHADIVRLGLTVDQRVVVRSEVGEMRGVLVREYDIREGNAMMYFPEANVLVPRTVDPRTKTPAFKSVLVRIGAEHL